MFAPFMRWWLIPVIGHIVLAQENISTSDANATLSLLPTNSTTARLLLQNYGTDDATTSGNYQILLCGAGQPNSKAAKLQALLPLIWQNLQKVIQDVKKGPASPHGYTAFFKSTANQAAVMDLFQKISAGDPVTVSADRARRLGSPTAPPSFACLEEGDSSRAHLYAKCLRQTASGRLASLMTWGATEIVMICPAFWLLPPGLTQASCPRVVGGAARPNDVALVASMYGTVVRLLAHVYLPETLDYGNSVVEQVENVQDAIELSAAASLGNANSYALYAGGE